MIPKIIHFCWFGATPIPSLALECIASWRKFLPDYEIWQWVDDPSQPSLKGQEFIADKVMEFDVNSIPYTAEAYKQKKYAFVSDYARFWILHRFGGVYFDTDVEVIRPMDDIIAKGPFMGFEQDPVTNKCKGLVNPGLGLAMCSNNRLIGELIDHYNLLEFDMNSGSPVTIVGHTTDVLVMHGLSATSGIQVVDGVFIYPSEYFCPIHNITKRLHVTNNTRSIHRYMDSWNDKKTKSWKDKVRGFIPEWMLLLINRIKH